MQHSDHSYRFVRGSQHTDFFRGTQSHKSLGIGASVDDFDHFEVLEVVDVDLMLEDDNYSIVVMVIDLSNIIEEWETNN
jgi:hypothetical protein